MNIVMELARFSAFVLRWGHSGIHHALCRPIQRHQLYSATHPDDLAVSKGHQTPIRLKKKAAFSLKIWASFLYRPSCGIRGDAEKLFAALFWSLSAALFGHYAL